MARTPAERPGTQSVTRAVRLMRTLAMRGQFGWRLSDLAAACDVDKGTAHRILACLVDERLVQQRASDRHYFPGPLLYELGLSLPGYGSLQRSCEARLAAFAKRMNGIALLLLRSGNEYVCSVRAGTIELRELLVYPGTRRPLFTSVGGVAIWQTLPAAEAQAVLHDNIEQEVAKRGSARLEALRQMRERSQRHGFGVNLGDVVPGLHAFAVPVAGPDGRVLASVCLMGPAEYLGETRLDEVRGELETLSRAIEVDAQQLALEGTGSDEP